jgi:hypothetical protein
MGELLLLLWVGSIIWVCFDAKQLRVHKGRRRGQNFDFGVGGWVAGMVTFWILFFPAYLGVRSGYVEAKRRDDAPENWRDVFAG